MLNHLLELRRRILYTLWVLIGFFVLFFSIAPHLFEQLISPLLNALPNHEPLIATEITTPLFIPIKLAADTAMLCTTPFAVLQLWYFIAPGLYPAEKKGLRMAALISLILFCTGVLFCFYIVLPFMLHFFTLSVPKHVRLMPDITSAVDFITRMLVLFGLCFQVPLITLFLVHSQLVTITTLKSIRPYVIVGAFTIGMLLTPPDVLSQVALALPLCVLYEAGLFLAIFLVKKPAAIQSGAS